MSRASNGYQPVPQKDAVIDIEEPTTQTNLDERQKLFDDIIKNDIEAVRSVPHLFNVKDGFFTPVHQAALCGQQDILRALLDGGAKVDGSNGELSPLHLAAWFGHEDCVKILLEHSPELRVGKLIGNELENCKTLDEKTLNVLQQLPKGSTALHLASSNLHLECVFLLLEASNDEVNATDEYHLTPLDAVGKNIFTKDNLCSFLPQDEKTKDRFTKLVSQLKSKGATATNDKVQYEETPLHLAVYLNSVDTIRELISSGYYKPLNNKDGKSALLVAVEHRLKDVVEVLVNECGAPMLESTDQTTGMTPLHTAVCNEWHDGVQLLIESPNGANILATTNSKQTVLHLAAEKSNEMMMSTLLAYPESRQIVNAKDQTGNVPLFLVVQRKLTGEELEAENNKKQTKEEIRPKETKNKNGLEIENNDDDFKKLMCIELLLSKGALIKNARDEIGNTILHLAVKQGQTLIVAELFKHSDTDDILNEPYVKESVLLEAADKGHAEITHLLIQRLKHARFDFKALTSPNKPSALHLASENGHTDVVRILLEECPELLDLKDDKGRMAIHLACIQRRVEIVPLLLNADCELAATIEYNGKQNVTAMQLLLRNIPNPVMVLEESLDKFVNLCQDHIKVDYKLLLPNEGNDQPSYRQMAVVDALVQTGRGVRQEELFTHPIIESFLFLQWKRFQRVHLFFALVYFLFASAFTAFIVVHFLHPRSDSKTNGYVHVLLCISVVIISMLYFFHEACVTFYWFLLIKRSRSKKCWLTLKKCSSVLYMLAMTILAAFFPDYLPLELGTFTILLLCIKLMVLMSTIPKYGFYCLMFFEVCGNFFKMLSSFSFILIGFWVTFYLAFHSYPKPNPNPNSSWNPNENSTLPNGSFGNLGDSLLKTLVMMTNEFDYDDLFTGFEREDFALVCTKIVFLLFVLLVSIVIMNILTAQAIVDWKKVDRLKNLAEFLIVYEHFVQLFKKIVSVFLRKLMKKNDEELVTVIKIKFDSRCDFSDKLRYSILDKAFSVDIQKKETEAILKAKRREK